MNGRDTKSILLVTLALLTAASSPLNIYGEKLQDARRWYERGREAIDSTRDHVHMAKVLLLLSLKTPLSTR